MNYTLGIRPIVQLHVGLEEKQHFESLRGDLRARTGFFVTQPGAFAAWSAFIRRRESTFLDFASELAAS